MQKKAWAIYSPEKREILRFLYPTKAKAKSAMRLLRGYEPVKVVLDIKLKPRRARS